MRRLVILSPLIVVLSCAPPPGGEAETSAAATQPATTEDMPIDQVPKSQAAVVTQRVANTEITVTYSRPVARGRELFGALVPYGEAWNPGADRATEIALSRDVTLAGHEVNAGSYTIWMIPRPGPWTVILSSAVRVRHQPYPGEAKDVLRVDVEATPHPQTETMTWEFPVVEGKDAVLAFRWGAVAVHLPMKVR